MDYEEQMLSGIDDRLQFRVWPDGTVQCVEDGPPHSHMSDDFVTVWAMDEEEAEQLALFEDHRSKRCTP